MTGRRLPLRFVGWRGGGVGAARDDVVIFSFRIFMKFLPFIGDTARSMPPWVKPQAAVIWVRLNHHAPPIARHVPAGSGDSKSFHIAALGGWCNRVYRGLQKSQTYPVTRGYPQSSQETKAGQKLMATSAASLFHFRLPSTMRMRFLAAVLTRGVGVRVMAVPSAYGRRVALKPEPNACVRAPRKPLRHKTPSHPCR